MLHRDLAVLLAIPGLTWETARVYLAIGDLTHGRGRPRAVVGVGKIAAMTRLDRRHVHRALRRLAELGLYGQRTIAPRVVERWIEWPPGGAVCGASVSLLEAGRKCLQVFAGK